MGEVVRYEVTDGVAVITLDRPEVRNALNLDLLAQLHEAAERAAADDTAGAVLVTGAGGAFSSGLDTSVFGGEALAVPNVASIQETFQAPLNAIEDIDKPVIAAIEGYCFGGGIQLAAACHIRMVAPTAQLSILESRWGLIPDMGGTHRIPRLIGIGRTTELTVTARRVGAEEAIAMGLAEVALTSDDPQAEALAYAVKLAAGPGALRRAPRLIRENLGRSREDALRTEAETQVACLTGPDFAEAVGAAIEGRPPTFTGG